MAYSKKIIFFLFSSLLLLHVVSSVEFTVVNKAVGTPGGVRFDNEIGVDCSKQIMVASTDFIWKIFQQSSIADRKNVHRVSLFIVTDYDGVAFASNNEIHVSASYIANYGGDVKREITGKYKWHEDQTFNFVTNKYQKGLKLPLTTTIQTDKISYIVHG